MIVDLLKVKGEYSSLSWKQCLILSNYRNIRYIETPINRNINIFVLFYERIKLENDELYPKFIFNGKLYGTGFLLYKLSLTA